jgi:hypothetical protein
VNDSHSADAMAEYVKVEDGFLGQGNFGVVEKVIRKSDGQVS